MSFPGKDGDGAPINRQTKADKHHDEFKLPATDKPLGDPHLENRYGHLDREQYRRWPDQDAEQEGKSAHQLECAD